MYYFVFKLTYNKIMYMFMFNTVGYFMYSNILLLYSVKYDVLTAGPFKLYK